MAERPRTGRIDTVATRHLVKPLRRAWTKLQLLARSQAGYAPWAAVTTLVLAITDGLEYLLNELRLTWIRLRLLSRDEAAAIAACRRAASTWWWRSK